MKEEQQLLRRLSVFAGGFTLEAAEQVVEGELDTLQSLVEKSLARFTGERYLTVRQYALERLGERGESRVYEERHARFFLEFADRRWTVSPGAAVAQASGELGAELDNLRLALRFYLAVSDAESAMRLAAAMRRYCRIQGHFVEARSWLQEILALLTNALVGLGAIYSQLGNYRLATSTLATATAAATAIQYTLERFKRWTYDRAIEVARAAMPADDFEAGWRRGARDGSRRGCQDGARVTSAVKGGRRFLPRNAVVGE